jgi:hypothetical protein
MIIALGHEAQVGKDTFSMLLTDYIRRKLKGVHIVREGFADRLYQVCHIAYNWAGFQSREFYMVNPHKKNEILPILGRTPREILIKVGNLLREYDQNIWLNPVVHDRSPHLKIITDLRKVNELDKCEELGVLTICIRRYEQDSTFESDTDLIPHRHRFKRTLWNTGTLNEFNEKVMELAEELVIPELQAILRGEKGK